MAVFVVGFTWIRSDLVEVGRGGLGCRFPGCVPGCFPGCGPGVFRWFGSRGVRFACGSIWWGRRWRSFACDCSVWWAGISLCVGLSLVGGAWGSGVQLWWGVRCRVPRVAIKAWASRWLPVTLSACRHPPFACNLNPSLALRGTAGRVGLSAASIKRALGALPKTLPPSPSTSPLL